MDKLRIAVAGVGGRMGRAVTRAALEAGCAIVGGAERADSPDLGVDIGVLAGVSPLGVLACPDPAQAAAGADAFIDFTSPEASLAAAAALIGGPALIIGSTGFSSAQEESLRALAARGVVVKSGNFSLGVNLLAALVEIAAQKLGPDWDIEILEAHHRRKADAPSGTALLLGDAAALGRGAPLSALKLSPFDGLTGPRPEGGIGFAVRRGGGVIGEHEVMFASDFESIRLSHQAFDRSLFARGALAAAHWAKGKPAGLYSMRDVLGV